MTPMEIIGQDIITGMGFVGNEAGVLYSMAPPKVQATASGSPITISSASAPFTQLLVFGRSTQDGTPSPSSPVAINTAGQGGQIGVSVTDGGTQSQTLTLSTPGGLPGIPVSSGGNYTDENGQQWVCDEVDFKRGVYVQRIYQYILKNLATTNISDLGETIRYTISLPSAGALIPQGQVGFCNILRWLRIYNEDTESYYSDSVNIVLKFKKDRLQSYDIQGLNAFLDEINAVAYYILATSVEHPLSSSELSAYAALRTYSPTTVVSNDAGCWMTVGYYSYGGIQRLVNEAMQINGGT